MKKDPNQYPRGWNRKKILDVIDHYDKQIPQEAIAEAQAAYRRRTSTLVEVPVKLLPRIRQILSQYA